MSEDALNLDPRIVPLFEIGPDGNLRPNPLWKGVVSDFCDTMRTEVGANPTVRCWPYRIGGVFGVAFDVAGDAGEVNLTIHEGDHLAIPLQGKVLDGLDPVCVVIDAVDAFYLVSTLLKALGLPSSIDGVAVFGSRRTVK